MDRWGGGAGTRDRENRGEKRNDRMSEGKVPERQKREGGFLPGFTAISSPTKLSHNQSAQPTRTLHEFS